MAGTTERSQASDNTNWRVLSDRLADIICSHGNGKLWQIVSRSQEPEAFHEKVYEIIGHGIIARDGHGTDGRKSIKRAIDPLLENMDEGSRKSLSDILDILRTGH